jgi:5-methyltetrahydrofolate--homocysteine methyltransferase
MAFDEQGQADTVDRKVAICTRAYTSSRRTSAFRRGPDLRSERADGGHRHRGAQRLRGGLHRGHPPDQGHPAGRARVGGISNISFSFRGNNPIREAMHAAFLYHAIQAGLDMGIVNAGQLAVYEESRRTCSSMSRIVLLNRRPTPPSAC